MIHYGRKQANIIKGREIVPECKLQMQIKKANLNRLGANHLADFFCRKMQIANANANCKCKLIYLYARGHSHIETGCNHPYTRTRTYKHTRARTRPRGHARAHIIYKRIPNSADGTTREKYQNAWLLFESSILLAEDKKTEQKLFLYFFSFFFNTTYKPKKQGGTHYAKHKPKHGRDF